VAKDLPVILASGTMDPVGDYSNGVKAGYEKLLQTGHNDVTLKLYENKRHEILNEVNKDEVYADLNKWIEEKVLKA